MRTLFLLFIHLIVTLVKLVGPGGMRAVIAESLIIKQQLIINLIPADFELRENH